MSPSLTWGRRCTGTLGSDPEAVLLPNAGAHFARDGLTPAQRRFARVNDATPGAAAASDDRLVFMYRDELSGTHRWLVDELGHTVESEWFWR
jgi:hypothetical protein